MMVARQILSTDTKWGRRSLRVETVETLFDQHLCNDVIVL